MDPEPLLSYDELARALNVGRRTLVKMVRERRIPYVQIARAVRFDLKAVLAALEVKPAEPSRASESNEQRATGKGECGNEREGSTNETAGD